MLTKYRVVLSDAAAISYMWLLSTGYVAGLIEMSIHVKTHWISKTYQKIYIIS